MSPEIKGQKYCFENQITPRPQVWYGFYSGNKLPRTLEIQSTVPAWLRVPSWSSQRASLHSQLEVVGFKVAPLLSASPAWRLIKMLVGIWKSVYWCCQQPLRTFIFALCGLRQLFPSGCMSKYYLIWIYAYVKNKAEHKTYSHITVLGERQYRFVHVKSLPYLITYIW